LGRPLLFNPFSVLNVLQKQKFGNFWFQTGTPTYLVDLLKQSGYLTIKGYDKEVLLYTLVFPNDEVRYAFLNFLVPFYTKKCN